MLFLFLVWQPRNSSNFCFLPLLIWDCLVDMFAINLEVLLVYRWICPDHIKLNLSFDIRTALEHFQPVGSNTSRGFEMLKFLARHFSITDFGTMADDLINLDSSFGYNPYLDYQSCWWHFAILIDPFYLKNFNFYYK